MGRVERAQSKAPDLESVEDEAAYWDTHSLAELTDDGDPVELEVVHPLRHSLTVSLEGEVFRRVAALAKAKGVGPSALARMWVLEALARAETAEPDRQPPTG